MPPVLSRVGAASGAFNVYGQRGWPVNICAKTESRWLGSSSRYLSLGRFKTLPLLVESLVNKVEMVFLSEVRSSMTWESECIQHSTQQHNNNVV